MPLLFFIFVLRFACAVLSAHQEEKDTESQEDAGEIGTSDSGLSMGSDLIMNEVLTSGFPIANAAMPVLNARSIMEIVEKKEISITTPFNHNSQHQGLEDSLFDFGDALAD